MVEFRWIIMSSFLMLVFKFPAATGKYSSFTVGVGDEVTLSCGNVIDDQDKCNSTTWIFSDSGNATTLFEHGQIHKEAKDKSDRLSVTANCSLVIKKVTVEDAGSYSCRQYNKSDPHQGPRVFLSVITMTQHKDNKRVTLSCSVAKHGRCKHRVKWLYASKNVDQDNKPKKTSQSHCSATVTFLPSFLKQKSKQHEIFKCKVIDIYTKQVQLLTYSLQSSGDDATTTTTISPTTVKMNTSDDTNNTESTNNNNQTKQGWLWLIIVSVGLSGLLISVVTVNIWTRTKRNKTQMDENMEHNDEDEDDGTVNYENLGDPSASVRLH